MLAVFGHQSDAGEDGVERGRDLRFAAAEKDAPRGAAVGTEDEAHGLGPA